MCGVPVERADDYLQRLIALGHRVAVCEQTEDPAEAKKRGAKSVVRRDVVRLVTPGTITEDTLLEPGRANLPRPSRAGGPRTTAGATALPPSTSRPGASRSPRPTRRGSPAEIARLEPREIVVPDAIHDDPELRALWRETRAAVTPLAARRARPGLGRAAPARTSSASRRSTASASSRAPRSRRRAARSPTSSAPSSAAPGPAAAAPRGARRELAIDAATRANLELTRTLAGERAGSLLAAIDRTVTPGGARLLAERLAGPLTDVAADPPPPGRGRVPGRRAATLRERLRAQPQGARPTSPARCRASRSSAAARATSPACATGSIAARATRRAARASRTSFRRARARRRRRSAALDPRSPRRSRRRSPTSCR